MAPRDFANNMSISIEFDHHTLPSPSQYKTFWNAYYTIGDCMPLSPTQEKALKESYINNLVKLCKKDGCLRSTVLTYADLGDGLFREWLDPVSKWEGYCNLCEEE